MARRRRIDAAPMSFNPPSLFSSILDDGGSGSGGGGGGGGASVSSSLGHPRKIMAPDKTRGTLSKGAYIYETFGKQMDKSNITEAERASSLRTSHRLPPRILRFLTPA